MAQSSPPIYDYQSNHKALLFYVHIIIVCIASILSKKASTWY